MQQRLLSMIDRLRRRSWHRQGQRMLLTTFWPQDYRRGAVYPANCPTYRITRYVHAADHRLFEVWGQPLASTDPDRSPRRPVLASTRAMARDGL
jgi:hypothetical protein